MPDSTVPIAFRQQFADSFVLRLAQMQSKFRDKCRIDEGVNGSSKNYDRVGHFELQPITNRYGDTPLQEAPFSRRKLDINFFDGATLKDPNDVIRMGADPQSELVKIVTGAANRKIDNIVVSALIGNAQSIDADGAATNIALPSSQKIVHGSAGMTLSKIQDTLEILETNEVDEEEDKFLAITPKQKNELLGETKLTSSDYQMLNSLQSGKMIMALGFNIFLSNLLTLDTNGDRACIAFTRGACQVGIGKDIQVRVDERPGKRYNTQIYLAIGLGAVRLEDERVVEIACNV